MVGNNLLEIFHRYLFEPAKSEPELEKPCKAPGFFRRKVPDGVIYFITGYTVVVSRGPDPLDPGRGIEHAHATDRKSRTDYMLFG